MNKNELFGSYSYPTSKTHSNHKTKILVPSPLVTSHLQLVTSYLQLVASHLQLVTSHVLLKFQ